MKFIEQLNQLQFIHSLVKRKATGSPKKLAKKLGQSRASTFRQVEVLKELGAPIEYCRIRESYIYKEEFSLEIFRVSKNET